MIVLCEEHLSGVKFGQERHTHQMRTHIKVNMLHGDFQFGIQTVKAWPIVSVSVRIQR